MNALHVSREKSRPNLQSKVTHVHIERSRLILGIVTASSNVHVFASPSAFLPFRSVGISIS